MRTLLLIHLALSPQVFMLQSFDYQVKQYIAKVHLILKYIFHKILLLESLFNWTCKGKNFFAWIVVSFFFYLTVDWAIWASCIALDFGSFSVNEFYKISCLEVFKFSAFFLPSLFCLCTLIHGCSVASVHEIREAGSIASSFFSISIISIYSFSSLKLFSLSVKSD